SPSIRACAPKFLSWRLTMKVFLPPAARWPIKAWVDGVPFDENTLEQVTRTAALKFVFKHVPVMPDAHAGLGSTVGTVIPTRGAIVPAAVGVDIGCGMLAAKTSLRAENLPDSLAGIREAIERAVPHGRTDHGGPNDRGAWGEPPANVVEAWDTLADDFDELLRSTPKIEHAGKVRQLGTLGTGNHFLEVCLDEAGSVWLMLHS